METKETNVWLSIQEKVLYSTATLYDLNCLLYFPYSYLEGILPAFNSCIDLYIEKLKPFADGVTPVPMKQHLAEVTLDVISKVLTISAIENGLRANFVL